MARWPKQIARPGVDEYGRTPLWYGAAEGDIERLNDAISAGEDVSGGDDAGYTRLHVAVQNGHIDIVRALLKAGAALNAQDRNGNAPLWTAVHQACLARRTEANLGILRLLLDSGANPDLKNAYGRTPREIASGQNEIVASLFVTGLHLP